MANGIFANYLGKLYDWGSITLSILGGTNVGVSRINISHKRDSNNIYGSGQEPIGYVNKNNEYSCTLSLLYDEFQQIVLAALSQGLTPMEIPPFLIIMQLGSTQDPLVPYKIITLQNCRFTTDNFDVKQNDGGFYHDYPISFAGKIVAVA